MPATSRSGVSSARRSVGGPGRLALEVEDLPARRGAQRLAEVEVAVHALHATSAAVGPARAVVVRALAAPGAYGRSAGTSARASVEAGLHRRRPGAPPARASSTDVGSAARSDGVHLGGDPAQPLGLGREVAARRRRGAGRPRRTGRARWPARSSQPSVPPTRNSCRRARSTPSSLSAQPSGVAMCGQPTAGRARCTSTSGFTPGRDLPVDLEGHRVAVRERRVGLLAGQDQAAAGPSASTGSSAGVVRVARWNASRADGGLVAHGRGHSVGRRRGRAARRRSCRRRCARAPAVAPARPCTRRPPGTARPRRRGPDGDEQHLDERVLEQARQRAHSSDLDRSAASGEPPLRRQERRRARRRGQAILGRARRPGVAAHGPPARSAVAAGTSRSRDRRASAGTAARRSRGKCAPPSTSTGCTPSKLLRSSSAACADRDRLFTHSTVSCRPVLPRTNANTEGLLPPRSRERAEPEGRVLLAHLDHAPGPLQERGRVLQARLDVGDLVAVHGVLDRRVDHPARVAEENPALRSGVHCIGVRTPSRSPSQMLSPIPISSP